MKIFYIYAAATLGTAFLAMLWGLRRASVATDDMLNDASEPWRGNRGTHLDASDALFDGYRASDAPAHSNSIGQEAQQDHA